LGKYLHGLDHLLLQAIPLKEKMGEVVITTLVNEEEDVQRLAVAMGRYFPLSITYIYTTKLKAGLRDLPKVELVDVLEIVSIFLVNTL
jgi:hypothetical protein